MTDAPFTETHRDVLKSVVEEFAHFAGHAGNWPIVGPNTATAIDAALKEIDRLQKELATYEKLAAKRFKEAR